MAEFRPDLDEQLAKRFPPRPVYSLQEKQQVVKLRELGYTVYEIAKVMGCSKTSVYKWVKGASNGN